MASVKLVDVNKSFDGNNMVVNGVNFSIGDGDFLVIVGPSGCGKSTTLNLIAGLDEVTSGQIYINDQLGVYADIHGSLWENWVKFQTA